MFPASCQLVFTSRSASGPVTNPAAARRVSTRANQPANPPSTWSILLFVLAALAEIGGAWLIWQGVREHKGVWWIGAGIAALGAYGLVATFQPDANFGRILAAYGGVFVTGSLGWAMLVDKFRPDRYDLIGALICFRRGSRHHVRAKDLAPDRHAMRARPRLSAGARWTCCVRRATARRCRRRRGAWPRRALGRAGARGWRRQDARLHFCGRLIGSGYQVSQRYGEAE